METINLSPEEVEQIEKQIINVTASNEAALSEDGEILAKTDVELVKSIARYRKMGLVPQQLDTDPKAAGAIIYAKQLGFNPLSVWGQIACIHGKFTVYGSLFTSLAQRDPSYGEDRVFFLDEKQDRICMENKNLNANPWACVVQTKKKGSETFNEFFFTVDDAKQAAIFKNTWTKYTKDMLFWKAISRSYRATYPLALQGVLMYEDMRTDWDKQDQKQVVDLNKL